MKSPMMKVVRTGVPFFSLGIIHFRTKSRSWLLGAFRSHWSSGTQKFRHFIWVVQNNTLILVPDGTSILVCFAVVAALTVTDQEEGSPILHLV